MRLLIILALGGALSAQEVSQSGLELKGPRPMVSQAERAPTAMIASASEIASKAGLSILRKGGNASTPLSRLRSRSRWRIRNGRS